jgi:glycosyltransferase involved in cell wall biosynthesis
MTPGLAEEKTHSLDLVIPCYNPPKGWEHVLAHRYEEICKKLGIVPTLILVNDGSSGGTVAEFAQQLSKELTSFHYVEVKTNQGKGNALRTGVELSNSEHTIYTDVDFPYTVDSIAALYHRLLEGNNVALGTRNDQYYESVPAFRRGLSKSFRWTLKKLLRLISNDTQCGLKGFDQEGKKVFQKTTINRFLFDLEFVLYCSRSSQIKLSKVPVQLNQGVTFSKMPVKILLREGWNFIKILFRTSKK